MDLCDDLTFVAFDLETTGLKPVADRIVEIGAVKFTSRGVVDSFQTLVDPQMPISPAAARVNGISDAMVKGQPLIADVLPGFLDFIKGTVLVAHHAPFDVGFVSYDLFRLNLNATEKAVLDTCSMSRRVFKRLPSYSLVNLSAHFSLKSERFHRALEDADACRQLFLKNVEALPQPATLKQLERLSGLQLSLDLWRGLCGERFGSLLEAFANGATVTITYEDAKKNVSERSVRPLALFMLRGAPTLEAWCNLRNEKRYFTLARIRSVA